MPNPAISSSLVPSLIVYLHSEERLRLLGVTFLVAPAIDSDCVVTTVDTPGCWLEAEYFS